MLVRKYRPGEELELWRLYYETVRRVSIRDYTEEQVRAWAPDEMNLDSWPSRIKKHDPYVCECDGAIVGFADIQPSDYIDQLFVHHAWQRKGVGRRLLTRIESDANDTEAICLVVKREHHCQATLPIARLLCCPRTGS